MANVDFDVQGLRFHGLAASTAPATRPRYGHFTVWDRKPEPDFRPWGVSTPEALSFSAIKEKLDSHFVHPVNEIYESRRFHRRTQQPGESVDDFFTALHNLVKRCGYNSPLVEDRLVCDRFVVGIRDEKLSDQLCRCTKPATDEALFQARIHEDAEKEQLSRARLTMDNALAETLNIDSARQNDTPTPSPRFRDQHEHPARLSCGFCGPQRHSRKDCPVR